ncbi:MAG: hypothetical protein C0461_06165 [Brevundimonas sp.]|nr:hypothetical protein [Brevundimonas sp.]
MIGADVIGIPLIFDIRYESISRYNCRLARFRLLGKLQALVTVTAIDWRAYASILDATCKESAAQVLEGDV